MDEIRSFLEENGGLSCESGLSAGDEERFFSKMDKPREIHFRRMPRRSKFSFLRVIAVPAAACVLVFLCLQLYMKSFQSSESLDGVYADYRNRVLALSAEIIQMSETESEIQENERTIEIITFEAIPMAELLPAELPLKERAEIMKDYYAQRLDGVKKFRDLINKSSNVK